MQSIPGPGLTCLDTYLPLPSYFFLPVVTLCCNYLSALYHLFTYTIYNQISRKFPSRHAVIRIPSFFYFSCLFPCPLYFSRSTASSPTPSHSRPVALLLLLPFLFRGGDAEGKRKFPFTFFARSVAAPLFSLFVFLFFFSVRRVKLFQPFCLVTASFHSPHCTQTKRTSEGSGKPRGCVWGVGVFGCLMQLWLFPEIETIKLCFS